MSISNKLLFSTLLACALSLSVARAHSPLLHSSPDKGESLATAPTVISLQFKQPVQLILVRLTSQNMDLKLRPKATDKSDKHRLELPALDAASYRAAWRAMGQDGHIMKGVIEFSVQP